MTLTNPQREMLSRLSRRAQAVERIDQQINKLMERKKDLDKQLQDLQRRRSNLVAGIDAAIEEIVPAAKVPNG